VPDVIPPHSNCRIKLATLGLVAASNCFDGLAHDLLRGQKGRILSDLRFAPVKRLTYILVAAVGLQLSGLTVLCAPTPGCADDCCTPVQQRSAHDPSPVAPCCVVSVARTQAAMTSTRAASEWASAVVRVSERLVPGPDPQPAFNLLNSKAFLHPISPPLNPLFQTCLLLI
jgi:hypothetical protein